MMHDPEMEITCDGENCSENLFLPMKWYVGGYDLKDSEVEKLLTNEHGWQVLLEKHYCNSCKET